MNRIGLKGLSAMVVVLAIVISVVAFLRNNYAFDTEAVEKDERLYNVGVILNRGQSNTGWNKSHTEGFEDAARELGVVIHYKDHVTRENMQAAADKLVDDGCRIIFITSYLYGDEPLKFSQRHPEVYVYHNGGRERTENMSVYFGWMYQARYLAGMVAGMATKNNHIGYIASIPVPEVTRGINAFALGVREVNPEAVVHLRWSGVWYDKDKEIQTLHELAEEYPIDMLAYHQSGDSVAFEADRLGIKTIGNNYDDRRLHDGNMIASVHWKWAGIYKHLIKDCLDGRFRSREYLWGLDNGVLDISYANNDLLTIEQMAVIDNKKYLLISGNWDVFYGPVYDQNGNLVIQDGEAPSDKELMTDMNWLVEGVDGQIAE